MHPIPSTLLALAAAAAAPTLRAQIRDGALLAGCYRFTGTLPCAVPGPGGLYEVDPRSGAVQALTGVPADVLGNGTTSTFIHGADFGLRLPHRSRVVTNAWGDGTIGQQMPIYVLDLAGLNVTAVTRYDAGIVGPGAWGAAGLPQAEALPDGRVLLAVDPLTFQAGEPLTNTLLAVLDPSLPPTDPNALLPVPMTTLPGDTNALAFDAARGVAWLGVFAQSSSAIYRVDFPQGGAPVHLVDMPGELVTGLALQHDGTLLATSYAVSDGRAQLLHVDPATAGATAFPQLNALFYAECIRIEPATGDAFVVAGTGCSERDVYRLSPASPSTGTLSLAVTAPAGGWGVASGLDIDPDPEVYGDRSGPSPLVLEWQVAPSAAGLPRIGNAAFALRLTASTPPLFAGIVLGVQRVSLSIAGLDVLVDPLVSRLLVPAAATDVPLPLPNDPGLVDLPVFGQAFSLDAALQLGASAGVQLTVLP
ncbi:MAG: hypothetical protein KDE27_09870 [Planctomycetes bacterium]|nr:hypothetical protein [Planctomycetota bacterium]